MDRRLTAMPFVAGNDGVGIFRVELAAVAAPADPLGGDDCSPRSEKGVEHQIAAVGSNNWAATAAHTGNGAALVANIKSFASGKGPLDPVAETPWRGAHA